MLEKIMKYFKGYASSRVQGQLLEYYTKNRYFTKL